MQYLENRTQKKLSRSLARLKTQADVVHKIYLIYHAISSCFVACANLAIKSIQNFERPSQPLRFLLQKNAPFLFLCFMKIKVLESPWQTIMIDGKIGRCAVLLLKSVKVAWTNGGIFFINLAMEEGPRIRSIQRHYKRTSIDLSDRGNNQKSVHFLLKASLYSERKLLVKCQDTPNLSFINVPSTSKWYHTTSRLSFSHFVII